MNENQKWDVIMARIRDLVLIFAALPIPSPLPAATRTVDLSGGADYRDFQPAIDGNQAGSVVTFSGTEDEMCLLAGFTIRNGMFVEGCFSDGTSGEGDTFRGAGKRVGCPPPDRRARCRGFRSNPHQQEGVP
jgi:hypothetical protein